MASVKKHTHKGAFRLFKHVERTYKNPSNTDIDPTRSHMNYDLLSQPNRIKLGGAPAPKVTAADRYKKRIKELYVYGRADVKTVCSWVVTAPKELKQEQERDFFLACARFMAERYGVENVVQTIVHKDESQAHLHFVFVPAVSDLKHGGEKCCANDVITREELRRFHPELQEHLTAVGITARVLTGITKKQGGNRTVRQMKVAREMERKREHEFVR